MPYEVRVDNYHGKVHVHPPGGEAPPVAVREVSMDEAKAVLDRHLRRHQALLFRGFLEELG